ncbi:Endonuclease, Uma2 family (restriction endonuclease fold) [Methylomagnum ishizawai]|uniref:Endonuclease, Uma2 family (Restriction endonuclease fold) n=1 Tax=Methylomagnum ishizawai TaxID=1760988 RepID=A0A1Y6D2D4_9GAMM|nr:Uma2 family endonuclease [Methylomagnum ishizawai]SMF94544.1 Endonuclease, Uma2 family (restriction endonuclease fold) [Methylomagnum ishizawai]
MSALPSFHSPHRHTVDEYLALDRAAEYKSEYVNGEIFAMGGASFRHVLITSNIARELGNRLKSTHCQVYSSDLRVQADRGKAFHYPDVTVICGRPEYRDDRRDTATNPLIIVEVLSNSTRNYDRGDKFASYRRLDSLREYILIDQRPCHIEHYTRKTGGIWEFSEIDDCGTELWIPTLEFSIPLAEIYAKVEFLEPEPESEIHPPE